MKVWLVLAVMNHAGLVVGPLPYNLAECERRIPAYVSKIELVVMNTPKTPRGHALHCQESEKKPR